MTRIFRVWLLGLVLCAGPPIELAQTPQPIRQAPGGAAPQHSLDRASTPRRAPLARYEFTRVLMGVPFKIALYALDNRSANEAAAEAYARIRELDAIMSDYDSESELTRLSRTAGQGKAVPVSEDLWLVLERSQRLAQRTGGAFDVTVGPLVRLWRRARRQRKMPSEDRLSAARELVSYHYLRLDVKHHTVELLRTGMRLDLGGIAKGYAADQALAVLRQHGIMRALVDGSGDIVLGDPPPGRSGWRIGIASPDDPDGPPGRYLLLTSSAVATSSDVRQYVQIDGKRFSHIVDPRTGYGLTDQGSVTVVAPDGITADSLASALSVLGPEAGLRLVQETRGTAALIVRNVNGKVQAYESANLKDFTRPKTRHSGDVHGSDEAGRMEGWKDGRVRGFGVRRTEEYEQLSRRLHPSSSFHSSDLPSFHP